MALPEHIRAANEQSYLEKAERRFAFHVDWKADVKRLDGGHCFYFPPRQSGDLTPAAPCTAEARYEVDGIAYCPRHLVLSER